MVAQDRRRRGASVRRAARTHVPAPEGRASLALAVVSLLAGSVQVQAPSCSTAASYLIYRISGGNYQASIKTSDFEYYGTQSISCSSGGGQVSGVSTFRQYTNSESRYLYFYNGRWRAGPTYEGTTYNAYSPTASTTCGSVHWPLEGDGTWFEWQGSELGWSSAVVTVEARCIWCPAGKYKTAWAYTDTSSSCLSCPRGTYGPNSAMSACDLCPAGQHTTSSETTASADCVEWCSSAGEYLLFQFTGGSCQTSIQASAFEYKATREVDGVPRYEYENSDSRYLYFYNGRWRAGPTYEGTTYGAHSLAAASDPWPVTDSGWYEYCSSAWSSTAVMTLTASCASCPAGKYKSSYSYTDTSSSCLSCPAGKYNPSTAQTTCTDCGAGKYSTASGATAESTCSACTSNSDAPAGSDVASDCICNAGFTSDGAGACQACAAGTYKAGSGNEACTGCGAGKYSAASEPAGVLLFSKIDGLSDLQALRLPPSPSWGTQGKRGRNKR